MGLSFIFLLCKFGILLIMRIFLQDKNFNISGLSGNLSKSWLNENSINFEVLSFSASVLLKASIKPYIYLKTPDLSPNPPEAVSNGLISIAIFILNNYVIASTTKQSLRIIFRDRSAPEVARDNNYVRTVNLYLRLLFFDTILLLDLDFH